MSRTPLIVEVTRGNAVESSHQVIAVVADSQGHVIHSYGNGQFVTLPRSAIKMLQALLLAESGAVQKFALTDEMLALACASHFGTPEHLRIAKGWLDKLAIEESRLVCAGHWPYNESAAHEMIRKNQKLTSLHNNCAGKHLGLLSMCLHWNYPLEGYEKYDHPIQQKMRQLLSEFMQIDNSSMVYGIDGCGIPTYGVPLQNLAIGMARMLNSKNAESRKLSIEMLLNAVRANPQVISGPADFAAEIIEVTQGRVFVKSGAEGVYTGMIPSQGLAFAVKAVDGAARAAKFVAASLLLQYKGVTRDEAIQMKTHFQPNVTNWADEVVGGLRFRKETS